MEFDFENCVGILSKVRVNPVDSIGTFWSSSQASTCYYQFNLSKVERQSY